MCVAFFEHKPSGCYFYRIKTPMEALARAGVSTTKIHINEDFNDDNINSFQIYGATPFSMRLPFKYMKENGKKIVYDMDDALDWIDESNPFFHSVKKDLGSVKEALSAADEITVSTPQFIEYLKGKTEAPITVVPNCYNPAEWMYPRPKREGIRIGFVGSCTHVPDLLKVIPAIKSLKEKYPITFIIAGFGSTSDYKQWYNEYRYSAPQQAIKDLEELDKALQGMEFEFVPYMDYEKYPSTLINMALDIGLCPLTDTPFNRCRSACKAMEYTLSGALALASDLPPYQEDQSSVLVHDWEETIEYYIQNPAKRELKQKEHLKWIQDNRNVDSPKMIELLKSVYIPK